MDVTAMQSSKVSPSTLIESFPGLSFVEAEECRWSPSEQTIYYDPYDPYITERLLHEIAHATLAHTDYERDIELIAIERDAWARARTVLAPLFSTSISSDLVENDLDTYRNWLHARSTCPQCSSNGIQTSEREYTCITCRTVWRVNHAIGCGLKRYIKITPHN